MSVVYVLLSVLAAALCIVTIVLVLLQKKRAAGWTSTMGGMGAGAGAGPAATYYDKNRGRTREGRLERYTKLAGVGFIVLSLILNLRWIV